MQNKDYIIGFILSLLSLSCYFVLMIAILAQSAMTLDSSSEKILALVFSILGVIYMLATIVLNALACKAGGLQKDELVAKKNIIISAIVCNFIMNVILIIVFALENMPPSFTLAISIAFHLFVFIGITIANSLILKEVIPLFQKNRREDR